MIEDAKRSITNGSVWDKVYQLDNYSIKVFDPNSKLCVIYFSSSAIYYPNTEKALEERVIDQDYYEWKAYPLRNIGKAIYVRDVAKQFYIYGINKNISTITAIIEFLRKETLGYNIVTVGSSSGGYMAALAGAILKAQKVYCFSGFFSLTNVNQDVWYLLKKEKDNLLYNQYYEISSYVKEAYNTEFVYVMPGLSKDMINNDWLQCKYVEKFENVYCLKIKEKNHGVCMPQYLLREFLNLDVNIIKKISKLYKGKLIGKWRLSIMVCGMKTTILHFIELLK